MCLDLLAKQAFHRRQAKADLLLKGGAKAAEWRRTPRINENKNDGKLDEHAVGGSPAVPDHGSARQYPAVPEPPSRRRPEAAPAHPRARASDRARRAVRVPVRRHLSPARAA